MLTLATTNLVYKTGKLWCPTSLKPRANTFYFDIELYYIKHYITIFFHPLVQIFRSFRQQIIVFLTIFFKLLL